MASKSPMPLLISVPHGGLWVPPEVEPFCRLDLPAILKDGDTWAQHLYNLGGRVLACTRFPVARAVVDVNRAADDRPPENPDGVVKTVTVDNEPVWQNPQGLSPGQVEFLLERYYEPYHRRLARASQNKSVLLGLDCHTMLDRAPVISSHPGEQRPLVCLSNGGDERGEALTGPVTAPPALLRALGEALERQLEDEGIEKGVPVVELNRPFRGGYIIQRHGSVAREGGRNNMKIGPGYKRKGSRPLPWIQVEFNRTLYLHADPAVAEPRGEAAFRVNDLRMRFVQALETFFQGDFSRT